MLEMQTKGVGAIREYMQRAPVAVLGVLLLSLLWNIAVCMMLLYMVFTLPNKTLRYLVVVFVAYIALATGPVGVSRYRVPVFPLLLVSVLGASYTFVQRKSESHA
jgi:uncharacterized membrane protein